MGPEILHFSEFSGDSYADGDVHVQIHRQNSKQGQYYVPGVGFNAYMETEMCPGLSWGRELHKVGTPLVKED